MTQLRLLLAAFLLTVGTLYVVNGPPSLVLAIAGLTVGVALLVTVALDLVWRATSANNPP